MGNLGILEKKEHALRSLREIESVYAPSDFYDYDVDDPAASGSDGNRLEFYQ